MSKYPVVTLCGSSRDNFMWKTAQKQLTLAGAIVLTIGFYGHCEGLDMASDTKRFMDKLHFERIKMSDAIYVLNRNHRIGLSTCDEIAFAIKERKVIWFYNPILVADKDGTYESLLEPEAYGWMSVNNNPKEAIGFIPFCGGDKYNSVHQVSNFFERFDNEFRSGIVENEAKTGETKPAESTKVDNTPPEPVVVNIDDSTKKVQTPAQDEDKKTDATALFKSIVDDVRHDNNNITDYIILGHIGKMLLPKHLELDINSTVDSIPVVINSDINSAIARGIGTLLSYKRILYAYNTLDFLSKKEIIPDKEKLLTQIAIMQEVLAHSNQWPFAGGGFQALQALNALMHNLRPCEWQAAHYFRTYLVGLSGENYMRVLHLAMDCINSVVLYKEFFEKHYFFRNLFQNSIWKSKMMLKTQYYLFLSNLHFTDPVLEFIWDNIDKSVFYAKMRSEIANFYQ